LKEFESERTKNKRWKEVENERCKEVENERTEMRRCPNCASLGQSSWKEEIFSVNLIIQETW